MTSLASREMTEQEMVNTCTAPQMAHLIQVLRQTIRNKDKEIERWVDMVSQLQRDGELDPPEPEPEPSKEPEYTICKRCGGSQAVPNPAVSNTAYTTCPICDVNVDKMSDYDYGFHIIDCQEKRIAELEQELKNQVELHNEWLGTYRIKLDYIEELERKIKRLTT